MNQYFQQCDENQLKEIYSEFNVTENSLQADVKILIDWLWKQPHLPNVDDEEFLGNVLLQCKNSIEKAKQKLDSLYTLRSICPEFYTLRDPDDSKLEHILKIASFITLPKLNSEGDQVIIFRIMDPTGINEMTGIEFWNIYFLEADLILKHRKFRKIISIFDMENMPIKTVISIVTTGRKITEIMSNFAIARVHKSIIINLMPALTKVFNWGKTVLPQKVVDRIEIVEMTDLTNILPTDVLPSNYGGNEKSIEELKNDFLLVFKEYKDWFISEKYVKADMSKRTDDRYKDISRGFGIDGSFRKLETD